MSPRYPERNDDTMEDIKREACFDALIRRLYYAVVEIDPGKGEVFVHYRHGHPGANKTIALDTFFADLRKNALTDSGKLLEMTASELAVIGERGSKKDFCVTMLERPSIINRFVFSLYGMPETKSVFCTVTLAAEADDVITIQIKRSPVTFKSDQIGYVDYGNHSVEVHCRDRVHRFFSISFADVAEMLLMHRNFVRSYKNCIVNMDKVERIENDAFVMQGGDVISIPKRRLREISTKYEEYQLMKKITQ